MKRFLLLFLCGVFLSGCGAFSPLRLFKKSTSKINQTEKKIDENHQKLDDQSKGYVYGADFSLSLDPTPSKFSQVAKDFTERSLLVTGNPSTEEALFLRKLVQDLLSTNALIKVDAEKRLKEKDKEVINLENQLADLNKNLNKEQEKYKKIAEENSTLAQKWYNLFKWIKWTVAIIIIGFVLSTISSLLPPPYSSITALIAMPIGIFVRFIIGAIPKIGEFAHTVSKKTYDQTHAVSKDLVETIQQIKEKKPEIFENHLEPTLKEVTSKEISRPQIEQIKKELGY